MITLSLVKLSFFLISKCLLILWPKSRVKTKKSVSLFQVVKFLLKNVSLMLDCSYL